jgi:hypothetical protein
MSRPWANIAKRTGAAHVVYLSVQAEKSKKRGRRVGSDEEMEERDLCRRTAT